MLCTCMFKSNKGSTPFLPQTEELLEFPPHQATFPLSELNICQTTAAPGMNIPDNITILE